MKPHKTPSSRRRPQQNSCIKYFEPLHFWEETGVKEQFSFRETLSTILSWSVSRKKTYNCARGWYKNGDLIKVTFVNIYIESHVNNFEVGYFLHSTSNLIPMADISKFFFGRLKDIIGNILIGPISQQGQNLCRLSLVFIIDLRVLLSIKSPTLYLTEDECLQRTGISPLSKVTSGCQKIFTTSDTLFWYSFYALLVWLNLFQMLANTQD